MAFVRPKSSKAKNRFANLMDHRSKVTVEQNNGREVFVTSSNGKNHFWVLLNNDPHWEIEI